MKKINNNNSRPHLFQKIAMMSVSTTITLLLCVSTASYASDIEIYKEARSGKVTLMFALDISGSMTNSGSYDLPAGCNATNSINDNFNNPSLGISYSRQYKACNQTVTTVTPVEKQVTVKVYSYYRYSQGIRRYHGKVYGYKCLKNNEYEEYNLHFLYRGNQLKKLQSAAVHALLLRLF